MTQLLTLEEVADLLQVDVRTVRRWKDAGDLAVVQLGRAVRVHPDDLDEFVAQRRGRRHGASAPRPRGERRLRAVTGSGGSLSFAERLRS